PFAHQADHGNLPQGQDLREALSYWQRDDVQDLVAGVRASSTRDTRALAIAGWRSRVASASPPRNSLSRIVPVQFERLFRVRAAGQIMFRFRNNASNHRVIMDVIDLLVKD